MSDSILQRRGDSHEIRDRPWSGTGRRPLIALVAPAGSYRTADFITAAVALRVDVIVASDGRLPFGDLGTSRSVGIDCTRPEWSAARIAGLDLKPDAVIGVDDAAVVIASHASTLLGHSSNPPAAVMATRDKARMRGLLAGGRVPQPAYLVAAVGEVPAAAAAIGFPVVVKPRGLSASVGVIRVDDEVGARAVETRIRSIVAAVTGDSGASLLVEAFVPGAEVAVEGMLVDGDFSVLALLDKPDPLDGPFFEETLFVTPSRHPSHVRMDVVRIVGDAVAALGLVSGPIHAEVRIGPAGVTIIEVAARSIGGLCGRALTFGLLRESLESLIIRSALGLPGSGAWSEAFAAGAMIVPIPRAGRLMAVEGVSEALDVPGIIGFEQTIPVGRRLVPLPEGDRYLGFLLSEAGSPDAVEDSLRSA
ncbi:MAG: ATP-grasp domain-containing protein, partial [Actinomycetia bacterium]|nr:ATP-grasp domain-containing protein [Actinomycetes bacterium]